MAVKSFNTPYELELNTVDGSAVSVVINNEEHVIYDSQIHLAQIPDEFYRVTITGMTEINIKDDITAATEFQVDYKHGTIYFDQSLEGTNITVGTYYGRGIKLIYAERIIARILVDGSYKSLQEMIDEQFIGDTGVGLEYSWNGTSLGVKREDEVSYTYVDLRSIIWRNAYSGVTAYSPLDAVSYNGSSYICILASTGNLPTNTTYWEPLALAGDMQKSVYDPTLKQVDIFDADNHVYDNVTSGLTATNTQAAIDEVVTEKANKTDVLLLDNTTAFTPTSDYHPATKKYVDDGDAIATVSNFTEFKELLEDTSEHVKHAVMTDSIYISSNVEIFPRGNTYFHNDATILFQGNYTLKFSATFISEYSNINMGESTLSFRGDGSRFSANIEFNQLEDTNNIYANFLNITLNYLDLTLISNQNIISAIYYENFSVNPSTASLTDVNNVSTFGYVFSGKLAKATTQNDGLITSDDKTKLDGVETGAQVNVVETDKKTATIIVGNSTNHTASEVDYLCDGTADDVQINQAVQALPTSGGKVKILAGTYQIADTILVDAPNITIEGEGYSTILERAFDGTVWTDAVIYLNSSASHITLKDFQIDGKKTTYTGVKNEGITNTANWFVIIDNIYVHNCTEYGLTSNSYNETVVNSNFSNNGIGGIQTTTDYGAYSNNIIENNGTYSIESSNSSYCTITGNVFNGNPTNHIYFASNYSLISDNVFQGAATSAIYLYNVFQITVSGNQIYQPTTGIKMEWCSSASVTGNTIGSVTNSITMDANCDYCIATGNFLYGVEAENLGTENIVAMNLSNSQWSSEIKMNTSTISFTELDNGNVTGTTYIDWNRSNKQKVTLTGDTTLVFSNAPTFYEPDGACNLLLKIVQDATGGRTITLPASVKSQGGEPLGLSTAPNAVDILSLYYDGTNYYGMTGLNFI